MDIFYITVFICCGFSCPSAVAASAIMKTKVNDARSFVAAMRVISPKFPIARATTGFMCYTSNKNSRAVLFGPDTHCNLGNFPTKHIAVANNIAKLFHIGVLS